MSNEQNSTSRHSESSMSILQLSTESLLFNDILEEKSLALRSALEESLKTQPYSVFNNEFSIFLHRIKRIGNVEQNASRSTTMAGSSSVNSRPNPISNMSNVNNNNATVEPNPLNSDHLSNSDYRGSLSDIADTFIATANDNSMMNNEAIQLAQNQTDEDDEDDEKYLNKWCVKLEEIKSDSGSTFTIKLIGVLVKKDLVKVLEKNHCAGILKFRKNKNLVQTDKGLYNLIGPICGGLPQNLFEKCLKAKGIPRTWKHFLTSFYNNKIIKKKVPLNLNKSFTRSGATYNNNNKTSGIQKLNKKRKHSEDERPMASTSKKFNGINTSGNQKSNKQQKHSENKGLNLKKIKNDNIHKELPIASTSKKFNFNTSGDQEKNKKQKRSEAEGSNLKKNKNDNIHKELPIASTSKKFNFNTSGNKKQKHSENEVSMLKKIKNDNIQPGFFIATASKKFSKINTPSQLLKYKFHQKLINTCTIISKAAKNMRIK